MQLLPTTQHLLHSWNLGESYDWSLSFPLESIYHLNDNSFFLNSSNCFWYRNLEGPLFPVSFWQDVSCRLNRKDEAAGKLFYKHRGTCKSARLLRWNFDRIFQLQRCFTAHGQSCWTKPSCHWSHLSLLNKCHVPQRSCRDGCETCDFVLCCRSGCCESICWTQIGTSCLCNAGFWISPTHGRDLSPKASKCACWFILVTPPKFNIAPQKRWLEDYFPIGKVNFQGLC